MILVKVRCRRCRSVVAEIHERPEAWDGVFTFLMCKCERPDPGRIVDVLIRKGIDSMPVTREIPWSELRPHVESALRPGGRTVDVVT